jgi:precorrin-2 dehydrogenase/sirohydrochlorin ferrochelatase
MKNNNDTLEKKFFPLMIDFTNKKVVIFGGGNVGTRKASILSKYADTTVISNTFLPKLIELSCNSNLNSNLTLKHEDINFLSDKDILNFISDAFLVIPATSNIDLNNRVIKIANKTQVLINHVTNIGNVIIPSIVHKKGIMIGISTQGQSPVLTKYIRKKLDNVISKEYEQMLQLTLEIRTYLKKNVKARKTRKKILWEVIESESVWNAFNTSYKLAQQNAYKIVATYISD